MQPTGQHTNGPRQGHPPPSWYPDPRTPGMLRWWDGARWTDHTAPIRVAGALRPERRAGTGRRVLVGVAVALGVFFLLGLLGTLLGTGEQDDSPSVSDSPAALQAPASSEAPASAPTEPPPPPPAPAEPPPTEPLAPTNADACRYWFDHTGDAIDDPMSVLTVVRDMSSGDVRAAVDRLIAAQAQVDAIFEGATDGNGAYSAGEEYANASMAFGEACGEALY